MNSSMEKLIDFMKENGKDYQIFGDDKLVVVENTEKVKDIQLRLNFDKIEYEVVQPILFDIARLCVFSEEKLDNMYKLCSQLNGEHCGFTFYVKDNKCTIGMNMKSLSTTENAAMDIYNDITLILSCIDEVYPRIMKAIWS